MHFQGGENTHYFVLCMPWSLRAIKTDIEVPILQFLQDCNITILAFYRVLMTFYQLLGIRYSLVATLINFYSISESLPLLFR